MTAPAYGAAPTNSLSNLQFEINNAVVLGPGTPYALLNLGGLGDMPGLSDGDVNRPRMFGQFAGDDFLTGLDIELDLRIGDNNGGSSIWTLEQNLKKALLPSVNLAATPNQEFPLWFQLPGAPLLVTYVRAKKATFPKNPDWSNSQLSKPLIWLHSTDPRVYGSALRASQTFTSATTASLTGTYGGNADMNPVFTITFSGGTPSSLSVAMKFGTMGSYTSGWSATLEPATGSATTYVLDLDAQLITKAANPYWSTAVVSPPVWPNPIGNVGGMMNAQASSSAFTVTATWTGSATGSMHLDYAPAYIL